MAYENAFGLQVHFHVNQTHFHIKGFALRLVFKQRHKVHSEMALLLPRVSYSIIHRFKKISKRLYRC